MEPAQGEVFSTEGLGNWEEDSSEKMPWTPLLIWSVVMEESDRTGSGDFEDGGGGAAMDGEEEERTRPQGGKGLYFKII